MSEKKLTKIRVHGVDETFIILYLRQRELQKKDLNLVKLKNAYEIFDNRIRSNLLETYNEFKDLKISLSDFFNVNIIEAVSKRRNNEFTLKKCNFDEEKEVNSVTGTELVPNLVPIWVLYSTR